MGKRPVWFWFFTLFVILAVLTLGTKPLYEKTVCYFSELFFLAKENIVAILAAFFLVKGKFVLKLFVKKILLLSATGLGKRYLVERVFSYHFKIHFLDHIRHDLKRLFEHIKNNFIRFPLSKKIIAAFAFLGSLGYIGKFMGAMLAIKVFVAKVWSLLLAAVLRTGTAVMYFFTDYIWGSWLAPIMEVILFSWLFSWLEKVPFLTKSIRWIYRTVRVVLQLFDAWAGRIFHHPLRQGLRWLLKKTRQMIYRFIGHKKVPLYMQLRELRRFEPNRHRELIEKRIQRKKKKKRGVSLYHRMRKRRA